MSKDPTDISTDKAYMQEFMHNSALFASMFVDLQKENLRKSTVIGVLGGIIISLFIFTSWAAYEVTERISVNEIRINQLEARIDR